MTPEEISDWIIKIGIEEFQAIDKQVQFKRKLERYYDQKIKSIDLNDVNDEFNRFEQECLDNGKGFEPYEAFIRAIRWIKLKTHTKIL